MLNTLPTLAATFAELSGATWWYMALYLATWVIHVAFMGYVLAGSAYLATSILFKPPESRGPFEPLLREWLPFMLSLAITAGIAPLLFVQILYRPQFYTANLLSFHRWMAVLPVLIVGFYLLYLLKTRWAASRSRMLDIVVASVTAACFLFIAWSWTENHLLSLAGQEVWSEQYASRAILYRTSQLLPRLAMWFCGMFPVLSIWLGWQLWWPNRAETFVTVPGIRRVASLGLIGLLTSTTAGGVYWSTMPESHQAALTTSSVAPFWVAAAIGGLGLVTMLSMQFQKQRLTSRTLLMMSLSAIVGVSGVAGLRESIRLASVPMADLVATHQDAAEVGGLGVFFTFLAINAGLITWCLRMVLSQKSFDSE